MWKRLIAMILALSLPASASAGPLTDAAEKAARELASTQREDGRSRPRFWTGIALVGGGVVLASLGGVKLGEDEGLTEVAEPGDDEEDSDISDDGEDSDKGGKALLAGGIAAAGVGSWLLLTGRKGPGPVVSVRHGRVMVRQTVRF